MNAGQPGRGTAIMAKRSGDPPVSNEGLSPKPVDYYADPDRRPYGFRLRNGASAGPRRVQPLMTLIFGLVFYFR
jgi:hypothetical protein